MNGLIGKKKGIVFTALAATMTFTNVFGLPMVQAAPSGFSEQHIATGFDLLSKHYTGKGVKVAVIDTGIDMDHPLFKGNIKKAYDYLEEDEVPQDEKGHGTHVSGIIMQQAPDADLLIYRVLKGVHNETGYTPLVVKAIKQAVADGAQVINLSLGADIDSPDEPVSQAVAEAVKQGVVVVKSAGNTGDTWSISSPGYGSDPIVVGATSQAREDVMLIGGETKLPLSPLYGASMFPTSGDASVIYAGKVTPEGLKNPKYRGKNVMVELNDSDMTVDEWYEAAMNEGLSGIIFALPYIGLEGSTMQVIAKHPERMIPGAVIPLSDAKKFKANSAIAWKWGRAAVEERMANLSSHGPAAGTWQLKPDLVAPGIHIYSSKPGEQMYSLNSGTSMAAPQVTAAAALLLEAHPDWTPSMMKSALMQRANQLLNEKGEPYDRTVQGAGSVNVEAALKATTFIAPASLSFGLVQRGSKQEQVSRTEVLELKNTSSETVIYELGVDGNSDLGKLNLDLPKQITAEPNQTVKIPVTWMIDQAKPGIWTGTIEIKGNKELLRVPVVLVNQDDTYPLAMGLNIGNRMYAPNGDQERRTSIIDYYLTVPSKRVLITATRLDEEPTDLADKTYVLLNQADHQQGLFQYDFKGKDLNGNVLPDGNYSIKLKSFVEQRQTVLEGESLYLDTKAPVITSINQSKLNKGQIYGKLKDHIIQNYTTSISIKKEWERHLKDDYPLITVQWRAQESDEWHRVRVNEEEGQFFADLRSADLTKGEHKLTLRVQDAFGNQVEYIIKAMLP